QQSRPSGTERRQALQVGDEAVERACEGRQLTAECYVLLTLLGQMTLDLHAQFLKDGSAGAKLVPGLLGLAGAGLLQFSKGLRNQARSALRGVIVGITLGQSCSPFSGVCAAGADKWIIGRALP